MSDLKPCPFCGSGAIIIRFHVGTASSPDAPKYVGCGASDCRIRPRTLGMSKAEAIETWNRRTEGDAPKETTDGE